MTVNRTQEAEDDMTLFAWLAAIISAAGWASIGFHPAFVLGLLLPVVNWRWLRFRRGDQE